MKLNYRQRLPVDHSQDSSPKAQAHHNNGPDKKSDHSQENSPNDWLIASIANPIIFFLCAAVCASFLLFALNLPAYANANTAKNNKSVARQQSTGKTHKFNSNSGNVKCVARQRPTGKTAPLLDNHGLDNKSKETVQKILVSDKNNILSNNNSSRGTVVILYKSDNYSNAGVSGLQGKQAKSVAIPELYPAPLKKSISLSGYGSIKNALMLLSRRTGIPVLFHQGVSNKFKEQFYFKNEPLYKILYGIVNVNGYIYRYRNGELNIYAKEQRIFHIPLTDLASNFSSSVGMSGMNSTASGGYGNIPQGAVLPETPSPSGQNATANYNNQNFNQTGMQYSNPGGSISLSLSENESLYEIIESNIKAMLSKKGKYFINPKQGLIWVKDKIANVNEISDYIKNIKKALSKQIFLQVEVIEVDLNKSFQTGINWNLLFNEAFKSNAAVINSVSISAPLALENGIVNAPSISFAGAGSNSAIISALQNQGKVNVVSQPRLTLIDGQTRVISSGVITPYMSSVQTLSYGLSQTQTYPVISQVQTGLSISFTPHIIFKNNTVSVTISLLDNSIAGYQTFSISGSTFTNPDVQSRSFIDTVNVKSGSTILVGGILTTEKEKNQFSIPFLSKIPMLGYLFKSNSIRNSKEDLIIMLTPKVID